uniref:mRNA splicing factor DIB1 n=1 Tax=Lotharella vacuolata TaxID=74820 RepID=A0A0H5BJW8_9EUKA|nr:mRNA splicing factor DIB1 [Lotharella vacuolata]
MKLYIKYICMYKGKKSYISDELECKRMDKILGKIAVLVHKIAVIFTVDINNVTDFNEMYELYDNCAIMFFFRNKHIMIDLGTGNNNKIDWVLHDKNDLINIIESVYKGARRGKNLILSPIDYSKRYMF